MDVPVSDVSQLSPAFDSILGRIVSRHDHRLGEILTSIARLLLITQVHDEVVAELAALRASTWPTVPTLKVVKDTCKHGLQLDWCAICKEQNSIGYVDSRGTAKSYKQVKKRKKDRVTQDVLYLSDKVTPGTDTLWNILPACELPKQETRFHQVTPEDVDWAERQASLRHIAVQKKRLNDVWCKTCVERTVMTTINGRCITFDRPGMYVEQDHTCNTPILVVDGVWKDYAAYCTDLYYTTARELWASRNKAPHTSSIPQLSSTANPVDVLQWVLLCETTLRNRNGGKRVSTEGKDFAERKLFTKDSCARDKRANRLFNAQQPWKQVPQTVVRCKRATCGKLFTNRKGTDHCSNNCRKRDWEEMRVANRPSQSRLP